MRCGLDKGRGGGALLTNRILRQKSTNCSELLLLLFLNGEVPYCHTVHSAILSVMTSYLESYDDKSDDWSGNGEFS